MSPRFSDMTISERAWYAWRCFPRDFKSQPPAVRELERRAELPNATAQRWIRQPPKRPTHEAAKAIARALHTTAEWLLEGKGEPPTPQDQVPEEYPAAFRAKWAAVKTSDSGTFAAVQTAEVAPPSERRPSSLPAVPGVDVKSNKLPAGRTPEDVERKILRKG